MISAVFAGLLAGATAARAGMTNTETGEQCWGTGCIDAGNQTLPGGSGSDKPGSSGLYLLSNIDVENCSDAASQRISSAVAWLQDNLPAIDATMSQSNVLMDWPGNSRKNFEDKLHKDLKFECINQKNKCERLWGRTVPILHQQRVALCTDSIDEAAGTDPLDRDALYIHVISHEIGHFVRLNGHASNCSFSDAVGFAAEYAFRGIPYQPGTRGPCSSPSGFDIADKLNSGNMEKPLVSSK
jgi:hypothetical protein